MNTLSHRTETGYTAPQPGESLKREIIAPESYVSVFHETKSEALGSIEEHGLLTGHNEKNIGGHLFVMKVNRLIDEDRPESFREAGISRSNAIFAYPNLFKGFSLGTASRRFAKRSVEQLRDYYDNITSILGAKAFEHLAVENFDDYVFVNTDPELLREQHPGEVLELKVDPSECYVGSISHYSDIAMNVKEDRYYPGEAEKWYWGQLVTLENFRKYYRLTEWDENGEIRNPEMFKYGSTATGETYCLLANAPDDLPSTIDSPEILIPNDIPPEHIRLLDNADPIFNEKSEQTV